MNYITKDPLVRVQDYTKNVSQGIFAPQYTVTNKARFTKSSDVDPLHTFGYRFTQDQRKFKDEREVIVKLKKKLDRERSLRHSITREVKELKQTLGSIKGSFAGSPSRGLPPTHPNRTRQH